MSSLWLTSHAAQRTVVQLRLRAQLRMVNAAHLTTRVLPYCLRDNCNRSFESMPSIVYDTKQDGVIHVDELRT